MKKSISISVNEEKLSAIEMYLEQKNTTLAAELEKYSALFTPWKIGNVEIKNRIVQCSMGGTSLFGC